MTKHALIGPTLYDTIHPCVFCEEPVSLMEYLYAKSIHAHGYYCTECEWFHLFEASRKRPKYTLYLEEKATQNVPLTKQNPVRFKKRLSPLRYPGGKSKLIDFIGAEIDPDQLKTVISPFTGGGSVELALLESGLTNHLILNDKDPDVYNFWHTILTTPDAFIEHIQQHPLSEALYQTAHDYMLGAKHLAHNQIEQAFLFLINNRCSFSGIYNAGRMGGKNGSLKDLSQRYNPTTIIKQITMLTDLKTRENVTIEVFNESYETIIETYAWLSNATFFIDPPYITEQAQSIYRHSFNDGHHHSLFRQLNSYWHSHPGPDLLLFYDNHERINEFELPEDVRIINRKYSIHN